MSSAVPAPRRLSRITDALAVLGDGVLFALSAVSWMVRRRPSPGTVVPVFYNIGVRSIGVILITGAFIGMVLAVQVYGTFHKFGFENRLGSLINLSVVRELGPVLAATMLAGRVGSAMAAELATMRISEQIDALDVLGANPIHYLVVPRLLASVLLIPLLTAQANLAGVLGGAFISLEFYHIEPHFYWRYSREFIGAWDIFVGLLKSLFFGAALALISCHRGFRARAGSAGVGEAATEAFVVSFIAILALDFFLSLLIDHAHDLLWPGSGPRHL